MLSYQTHGDATHEIAPILPAMTMHTLNDNFIPKRQIERLCPSAFKGNGGMQIGVLQPGRRARLREESRPELLASVFYQDSLGERLPYFGHRMERPKDGVGRAQRS